MRKVALLSVLSVVWASFAYAGCGCGGPSSFGGRSMMGGCGGPTMMRSYGGGNNGCFSGCGPMRTSWNSGAIYGGSVIFSNDSPCVTGGCGPTTVPLPATSPVTSPLPTTVPTLPSAPTLSPVPQPLNQTPTPAALPTPAVKPIPPAPTTLPSAPKMSTTQFELYVPTDATVYINGNLSRQTGDTRKFITWNEEGQTYNYTIQVLVVRNGQTWEHKQTLAVQANQNYRLTFNPTPPKQTYRPEMMMAVSK